MSGSSLCSVCLDMSVPTWVFQTLYKIQSNLKVNAMLFLQKLDLPKVMDVKHPASFPRHTGAFLSSRVECWKWPKGSAW